MRLLCLVLALAGCHRHEHAGDGHGHSHGHEEEHGHGHGDEAHGHGHEDDGDGALQITRWSETHELFVELEAPVVGKAGHYTAHVTRIADNHAVTDGVLEVDWVQGDAAAASYVAFEVARPGIFSFSAPTPDAPGTYTLRFTYRTGETDAVWTGGPFDLSAERGEAPDEPSGAVSFLKEAQWQIPFETAHPVPRRLARPLRLVAEVVPDPEHVRAVPAPVAGRVRWVGGVGSMVGARVEAAQVLARVHPATSADWSTVRLRVSEGEVEEQRAAAEVKRLTPLVRDGLVPGRRLDAARATLDRARARARSARRQRDQAQGAEPEAIPAGSPGSGTVVARLVEEGALVRAGQPIARVTLGGAPLLRAEVLPAEVPSLAAIGASWVDGAEPTPLPAPTTAVLVADPHTGLAPLTWVATVDDLALGAPVPLLLEVGAPTETLSVPRSAVVEINTRPFVYLMRGGESFTRRAVQLGPGSATHVGVLSGLTPEDRVVVRGGFDVYVASLAGTLESHRH